MNNKVKKLISGVLALSIVVSGNGIVGFADEVNAKSTEQTINSETNESGTNLGQNLSAKDESPTPSMEQAKPDEPAAIEFRPEEITLPGETAHNPYLEKAVNDLNVFIKEYNSKATREEKIAFAKLEVISLFKFLDIFRMADKTNCSNFEKRRYAEYFKFWYILCCVYENPYLADTMKEIAEIQKVHDSKAERIKKLFFIQKEAKKIEKNTTGNITDLKELAVALKISYIGCSFFDFKKSNLAKARKLINHIILFIGKCLLCLACEYSIWALVCGIEMPHIPKTLCYLISFIASMNIYCIFDFLSELPKVEKYAKKLFS